MIRLKSVFYLYKNIFFSALLLAAVIFAFQTAISNTAATVDKSAQETQYNAIKKAAVQCYALEGFFPPNIDYLVENYGLIIDNDRFIVRYEAEGGNFMPDITVISKFSSRSSVSIPGFADNFP